MKIFRAGLAACGVVILVAAYVATRPAMEWAYGTSPIRLGRETVYLKYHDCGAVCSGQMYLSRNSKRCARENPDVDYLASANDDTLDFAVESGKLIIADDYRWQPPKQPWLSIENIPTYGHAADAHKLQYIMFGNHLDSLASDGIHIDVRPCRVFPDGLFDGSWHEWAN